MKWFNILALVSGITYSQDLKSIPCRYLMSGEVLESDANSDGRYCIFNMESKPSASYLIPIVSIIYANNQVIRNNYVAMPICPLSKILLFSDGVRIDYMVDTLTGSSWVKRLYRRSCED